MSNVLDAAKREQVIALGRLGWPLRRIEEATGVRRETAGRYLRAAGVGVRGPGRWGHGPNPAKEVSTDSGGAKPASEVSTDSAPRAKAAKEVSTDPAPVWPPVAVGRSPQASACDPYRDVIEDALGRGRNAMAIYQDLVDRHGFTAGYASVRRYALALRGAVIPDAHAVIETAPGEEAQVDYGEGPMVRDPATGKYRRTRLFVLTLGYSRKCVRLLTFQSSSAIWAELHEQAFRRLGGAPRVVVLDNLKEGVLKPDRYDPTLNPLYRDTLAHYGVVALPCRVRDPEPQRQGGARRRACAGHTAEGDALRESGRGAGLPRQLGGALGRHAHPRHHQAPGGGDVCRRAAAPAAAAAGALPRTTRTARAPCTSTGTSKSPAPTTPCRRDMSAARSGSNGMCTTSAF